ncbi:hypothetical protein XENTR_v10012570 [Xenopus tropicalis]|nr:hypothetical protein XENTR_v10012570 [Xenopus tropicalis]
MEILIKLSVIALLCGTRVLCQYENYDYDTDYGPEPNVQYPPIHVPHNVDYSDPQIIYTNDCARECFCPPAPLLVMYCDNRKLKNIPQIPSRIQHLYLQFNDIEAVMMKSFINATSLKEINLSHNKIKSNKIEVGAFAKLRNLEQIFIDHNDLVEIPPDLPSSGLVKLTMLDLCNNHIDSVKSKTLNKLARLMQLNMCNNKLHSMPASLPTSLMYLSIENNSISNIPDDYFTKLPNLLAIRMSHNNLEEIPTKIFNLPNLVELNLGHNKLQQAFFIPRSLQHLYIQDNELESLNMTIMCPKIDHFNTNHLTYLRVDQNKLQAPISTLAYLCFPNMQRIYYGEQKYAEGEIPKVQEPMLTHPTVSEEEEEDEREGIADYRHEEYEIEDHFNDYYN